MYQVAALWIRISFIVDPDFYLNADSDPGQTLNSQKVEFLHEKYIYSRV
jgi:hypothetical protein